MRSKVFAVGLAGLALLGGAAGLRAETGHPALSPQDQLRPCAECHREVTPEIYREWFDSRHGLDNVKCFQCHGTYEDMEREPSPARCAPCHAREVAHRPAGRSCDDCHPAHGFSVHRQAR